MENGVNQRIEYIDIAKALAIILIVISHTVSDTTVAKDIISGFVLRLFFILSGLTLKKKEQYSYYSWHAFLSKRFVSLIIPYVLWAAIYTSFSFKNFAFIAYGSRETLVAAGSLTSLWFIPVMFLACCFAEIILSLSNKASTCGRQHIIIIASMIILALVGFSIPHLKPYGYPWGLDVGLVAAAFMIFGFEIKSLVHRLYEGGWILNSFILLTSSVLYLFVMQFSNPVSDFIFMAIADYGNPVVFVLSSIFGSIAVLSISILISRMRLRKKLLLYIGAKTLGIFVIHKPIVRTTREIVSQFGFDYNFAPIVIAITILGLAVSIVVIELIEKFAPCMLGKSSQTHTPRLASPISERK